MTAGRTAATVPGRYRAVTAVVNPAAGTMSDDVVAELVARCEPLAGQPLVHRTTGPGDATRVAAHAAAGGAEVVVAVGGDGTVREVVRGLAGADRAKRPALLIVPAGTGNSNYLAQWGEMPWPDAVTAALSGTGSAEHLLDLARLTRHGDRDDDRHGDLVLLGACSGLIAEALITARSVPESGRARYRTALARTAERFEPYPGRVVVDGVEVHSGRTVLANVGGGRHRGGTYQVLPHSMLDDGLLDVCVIGAGLDAVLVPELTRTASHLRHPAVVYARGRSITVERTDGRPISFERDGELCTDAASRVTVRVLPRALRVLCRAGLPSLDAPAADFRPQGPVEVSRP